jgi:hypothetical protein
MVIYGYVWLLIQLLATKGLQGPSTLKGVDQEKTKTLGPHVFSVKASNWCMETMEEIWNLQYPMP